VSLVTIIVPTRDNLEMIRQVTTSVIEMSSLPFELIIIDNASTQSKVVAFLEEAGRTQHVRVLRMTENRYYWPAINAGVRASNPSSRYFLALNDDIIVLDKHWLQRLIDVVESSPQIGYVGDQRPDPSFRPLGGWVDGYCAMFRREMFDTVGLFNEARPFNWGFVDFQLRAYKHGYRGADIKRPGDVRDHIAGVVRHLRGRTIGPITEQLSRDDRLLLLGTRWRPFQLLLEHGFYWAAFRFLLDRQITSGAARLARSAPFLLKSRSGSKVAQRRKRLSK